MTPDLLDDLKALDPSKRQFLAGTGTALALSAVPWTVRKAWAQQEWDLIVIGAGTAGLPAALFAAERGAKVLVIERAYRIGGTLLISSGQISAAGTKIQARKGIKDSPEQHFDDVWKNSFQTVEPDIVRVFTQHAASTLDWLTDHGFEVAPEHPTVGGGHEPYSVPRYQWGPEGGLSIFKALQPAVQKQADAGHIKFLVGTSAVDLIQDADGAVRGVVASDHDGRRTDYRGRHIALTAGGYCASAAMFKNIHGMPLYGRLTWPYNDGSGTNLGLGTGGYGWSADNQPVCSRGNHWRWGNDGCGSGQRYDGHPGAYVGAIDRQSTGVDLAQTVRCSIVEDEDHSLLSHAFMTSANRFGPVSKTSSRTSGSSTIVAFGRASLCAVRVCSRRKSWGCMIRTGC